MRRALHAIWLPEKPWERGAARAWAAAGMLLALVGPLVACTPAGLDDGGAALLDAGAVTDGGSQADGGAALAIVVFTLLPVPLDDEVEVSWQTRGDVDGCTLTDARAALAPTALAPAGEAVRVPADFAAADHLLDVTLLCIGPAGEVSRTVSTEVPRIVRFEATPPIVAAGEQTVLCWTLEGGVDPVCAIFAEATDEYYYPLDATGCLFPLTVEGVSSFKLYCSPTNGYVEQTLVVDVNP